MSALAKDLELRGDEALAAGDDERAIELWWEALDAFLAESEAGHGDDTAQPDQLLQHVTRLTEKIYEAQRNREPEPDPPTDPTMLQAAVAAALEAGELILAAQECAALARAHTELADPDGAESALRQAVALARDVDAADPELTLWAFSSLVDFLSPSEESVALAQEMAATLIERTDMWHPMRAAEAATHWALAELAFAEVAPHRVDHAVDLVARRAVTMLDEVCFHDQGQELRRRVAHLLRSVDRHADADTWQADADRYEDWSVDMDQQIPGHVHLWDIRYDLPGRGESNS